MLIELEKIAGKISEARHLGLEPCFTYERVSAAKQTDGQSLDYQVSHSERYASAHGLHIVHAFTIQESARKQGRKVFNSMLDLAAKFVVRHLVFKSIDRMSRNYDDLSRIEKLIDESGLNVHFYQGDKVINSRSDHNDRMIIGIELVVSKHTSDKISHDIRESNRFKVSKGVMPGMARFGYVYESKEKIHRINPVHESALRFLFDTFDASRLTIDDMVLEMAKQGYHAPKGGKWRKQQLHRILTSPIYAGRFQCYGEIHRGTHDAFFTWERYEERLKRLSGRYQGSRQRLDDYLLARFVRCRCGMKLTPELKKGRFMYYSHICRITGKREYVPERDITAAMDMAVEDVRFSNDFAERLKGIFGEAAVGMKDTAGADRARISRAIAELEKKQAKLVDLLLEMGDKVYLQRKLSDIQDEIDILRRSYRASQVDTTKVFVKISEIIDTLREAPQIYAESPFEGKVEIMKSMARSITYHEGHAVIEWLRPYSYLLVPEILEVRESPVMRPSWDLLRTVILNVGEYLAA